VAAVARQHNNSSARFAVSLYYNVRHRRVAGLLRQA